ncbi:addiction module antidote protein, HigA family [Ralstonia sp. 25mfcol4.1]|uniref:HigA family addiction module antitoxin n=1 Tax=Burkholderiaceae TaxID=119060 RepID=UPI000884CC43|nr:HigA family addiction module antitoxin [Ralstonia sp. 25mfcol4.1]SDP51986.1 addiction module antidote protein, HigA family [Ralstonia sp. 25mfcol4.1]
MSLKRDDLSRSDFSSYVTGDPVPPTPPGDILLHEFMVPNALSAGALAVALRVPVTRIEGILWRERAISPETALRLARFFGTSAEFWVRLEANHALRMARAYAGPAIERDVQPITA